MERYYVGVTLTGSKKVYLLLTVKLPGHDFDSVVATCGFVDTRPTHAETPVTQQVGPQVQLIVLEEGRILERNL